MRFLRSLRPRRKIAIITTVLLLLCVLAVTDGLLRQSGKAHPVINDIAGRPLDCLAYDTPPTAEAAAPDTDIWTAMQRSVKGAALNIQQLQVPSGKATPQPYLAALIARHCTLIITIGPRLGAAATVLAHSAPQQHFLIDDDQGAATTVNITRVDSPSAITAALAHQLHAT
jgi:hypothetical protein